MPVDRELPSDEARELISLVRDLAATELAPRAAEFEERGEFPRDVFRTLGRAGLLGLAYDEELGGGGQPYVVYLQVLEELATAWAAVALGVSVHTLSCHPLAMFGSDEQKKRWLPDMLGGELLGAYCLSEANAGSDAASLQARARRDGDRYLLDGTKAWVTHGGVADYYDVFCRTSEDRRRGISLLLADADTPGLLPQPPEKKMGLRSSPTAQIVLDGAQVDADRLIGEEGDGLRIALSALDGGRLGISAVATGVAQAALDAASSYARERTQFGRRIVDFQGVGFLLADMATGVEAARATYLAAARRRDAGKPYGPQASMAKLFATDTAMKVTTDAVQVLGGYGYTTDFPVERYMREVKVMQIFEGTNQIQRMVIGRHLADPATR
ncbi:MAG TPA: acyl-CoA dehydrogenase family protein [Mycobacteriales bacterium]|nr:acyl-CoA dehydrogenase family protein [Mycobacteriales bacterium]